MSEKHPSFGWLTREELAELFSMKDGEEYRKRKAELIEAACKTMQREKARAARQRRKAEKSPPWTDL